MVEAKICVMCGLNTINDVICDECGQTPHKYKSMTPNEASCLISASPMLQPKHFSMFGNLLKISPDGFWVRCQKVEQNGDEAKIIYQAFLEYLSTGKR